MSENIKKAAYALIIMGGLGVAVWQMFGPKPDPYPDTEESATGWICDHCQELKMLTARERNAWTLSEDKVLRGRKATGGAVTMGSNRTVFKCEACSEFALVRARQCPVHNAWHLVRNLDGDYVGCEQCNGP